MSELNSNVGGLGMDLEQSLRQLKKGKLTYALNGMIEGFDGQFVNYQNEPGNEPCVVFPDGYRVIGIYTIYEQNKVIYFLANPDTGDSEIGESELDGCTYSKIINGKCLNFSIEHPVLSAAHRIDNCSTQIFWVDGYNRDRWIDLNKLPYEEIPSNVDCENPTTNNIDCNKLSINPLFKIPQVALESVTGDGNLVAGTYQFAVQYSNSLGEGYTSYYSVTNPTPLFDKSAVTLDFNFPVNKSIKVKITHFDRVGYYDYFNLAVIKTVNDITSVDLVGTYKIVRDYQEVVYTGQMINSLDIAEIIQKYPLYVTSNDITTANDILIRDQLTSAERLSYQLIANDIKLQWQSWSIAKEFNYGDALIATDLRGYMRDEVYAFEIVFLLKDGRQTDRFHIPGRLPTAYDLEIVSGDDVVDTDETKCDTPDPMPRWKVYNTATLRGRNKRCLKYPYSESFSGLSFPDTNSGIDIILPPTPSPVPPVPGGSSNVDCCYQYEVTNYSDQDVTVYYTDCQTQQQVSIILGGTNSSTPNMQYLDCVVEGSVIVNTLPICLNSSTNCVAVERANLPCNNCQGTPPEPPIIDDCCVGPYEYGDFAYWESEETYPCREDIWGDLAGKPIRHHKFPDSLVSHIHDSIGNIYPIGVKLNLKDIKDLINNSSLTQEQKDEIVGFKIVRSNRVGNKSVVAKGLIHNVGKYEKDDTNYFFPNYPYNDLNPDTFILNSSGSSYRFFDTDDSKKRFVFHSPDTHFYQPNLGGILKLETAEFGKAQGHFVQVKEHAKYKLYTPSLYFLSIGLGLGLGALDSGPYVAGAATAVATTYAIKLPLPSVFTAIQIYGLFVDIFQKLTPYKNYAYQYNSIGNYSNYTPVQNAGNKQRRLDLANYILEGYANVGDTYTINNFQRESSVYLRTQKTLPFVSSIPGVPADNSRFTIGANGLCKKTSKVLDRDISSYYASIKKTLVNQYGQIYSYESVDTGFQVMFDELDPTKPIKTVFGGDIFINRFAYKSKFPFFIDDRIGNENNSDIFYDEVGNINSPRFFFTYNVDYGGAPPIPWYWRIIIGLLGNIFLGLMKKFFAIPYVKLDCQSESLFYYKGYMYINAIGIPYYFCESEVNVDLRQAFNTKEGDFYPRVGAGIPDNWLQPINVPMAFDNTYYYNKTFSKQNKENFFSFLPPDYSTDKCVTVYPFRAVFSEASSADPFSTLNNNWLIYKPASYFDFPQNFGKLTSLDGIAYREVLARFENRIQKYNALLTAPTNQADVYLGQPLFSTQVPPVDLAVTDQGYAGTRHRFLLRTEYGTITVDDKRGHVFLIGGQGLKNLTDLSSGVEQFFNRSLEVKLPKYVSGVPIDNTFNGVGITGVYDAKYNRLILTKLDYEPRVQGITYSEGRFYYENQEVQLSDITYFCNKSFTISYDFETQSWISFHSYLPSYYIGSSNFYLSGNQEGSWRHLTTYTFNEFYGNQAPYILEYPYFFELQDEILQSVQDYSKTLQYINGDQIEVNDVYFNKVILYNNQQCSGILKLAAKPRNNLNQYMKYPIYDVDSKTILYTKSDNLYKINQFWSLVRDHKQPIFNKTCQALSFDKELNQSNMNYSKMSFKKAPLRAKDLKCRFILDDRTDTRIVSQLVVTETQKSFK